MKTYKSQGALKTYRIHKTPTQVYRHLEIARAIMPLAQLSVIPTRSFWYAGVDFLVLDLLLSHSWISKSPQETDWLTKLDLHGIVNLVFLSCPA